MSSTDGKGPLPYLAELRLNFHGTPPPLPPRDHPLIAKQFKTTRRVRAVVERVRSASMIRPKPEKKPFEFAVKTITKEFGLSPEVAKGVIVALQDLEEKLGPRLWQEVEREDPPVPPTRLSVEKVWALYLPEIKLPSKDPSDDASYICMLQKGLQTLAEEADILMYMAKEDLGRFVRRFQDIGFHYGDPGLTQLCRSFAMEGMLVGISRFYAAQPRPKKEEVWKIIEMLKKENALLELCRRVPEYFKEGSWADSNPHLRDLKVALVIRLFKKSEERSVGLVGMLSEDEQHAQFKGEFNPESGLFIKVGDLIKKELKSRSALCLQ